MGIMKPILAFTFGGPAGLAAERHHHNKSKEKKAAASRAASAEEERKLNAKKEQDLAKKQMLQGNQNILGGGDQSALGNVGSGSGRSSYRGRLLNM